MAAGIAARAAVSQTAALWRPLSARPDLPRPPTLRHMEYRRLSMAALEAAHVQPQPQLLQRPARVRQNLAEDFMRIGASCLARHPKALQSEGHSRLQQA